LSAEDPYPVEVSPGSYVLLIAPIGTRLNPDVFGPASERAEAFCQKSDKHMIVVIRGPNTVVEHGEGMDIMYFMCIDKLPHLSD